MNKPTMMIPEGFEKGDVVEFGTEEGTTMRFLVGDAVMKPIYEVTLLRD